ncbi:undecaprenyl-diphosphatase UppP [Candidatus Shapirobacteria bacterium CG08_land_8_20_14_0_20_39_18]|uniref:Undecaprenyl-diphosphatase n=1 Tax=Candidatus Shapirobacteria bacterium CG08_land_8_20_14_0_20_39_18 TaxID=1974883 RepID=A0A2M6XE58_9BACT|nr:MAG: undecaprenyl-diphosphatase UppP [Candidatus Shapirobacteria bacterium CG08_land_8_20_14_0_20_39_18]PIY64725.1 MAG: undecaprenyl-diphosphatase UppP [Candidatus Shapirobacteria bacterium CG_4_10_14_0_8_um_filter_39_15]
MNIIDVLVLAVVQGLTEFLPISSSGHLAIFQKLLGFNQPVVFFDILLHLGSLMAILIFFRKKLIKFLDKKYFLLLVIGTIPAVIFSLLFDKKIESSFTSIKLIGLLFIVNAFLLLSTKFIKKQVKNLGQITWKNAAIVGIFQAIAVLPSISRSGATITSALWQGFSPTDAFEFSFFLAIPAIIGAFVFKIKDISLYSSQDLVFGTIGLLVSLLVSYFALGLLQKILKSANFFWFGIYCLILGIIVFLV